MGACSRTGSQELKRRLPKASSVAAKEAIRCLATHWGMSLMDAHQRPGSPPITVKLQTITSDASWKVRVHTYLINNVEVVFQRLSGNCPEIFAKNVNERP